MEEEDTTKSTPFIVGMVFFAVGVLLLIFIIIIVMYFCIYRRKKKQFEKKKYLTMDNSIVYTKSPPSLDMKPPSLSREVTENGNIQTITTMSPLESPNTIYTIENDQSRDNVFVTAPVEPKLSQSFDSVDHANGKKYVMREVYAVDGTLNRKGHKKKKVRKAYSSYSWNKRGTGGGSLFGTKRKKYPYGARSERGYRTGYTNGAYHTDTIMSKKSHQSHHRSAPTLVRLQPVSFATMPTKSRGSSSSSQQMYVVSNGHRSGSSQSVLLSHSPPRSRRNQGFAVAHSLDGFNTFDDDHMTRSKSHNTSRDYSVSHDQSRNSTDGNYLQWSPTMKAQLEAKDKGRVSRSNSDLTSISRSGRKRGIGEHKYMYDPKYGTLEQF